MSRWDPDAVSMFKAETHRPDQGGEMNHEDLIDYICGYVGCDTDWERIESVAIGSDGVVTVRVTHASNQFAKALTRRYNRMRDEARARDRVNLQKLGES